MTNKDVLGRLLDRIRSKSALVGIIGLGYVGLPLTATFAMGGYTVVGFDVDQRKVDCLNAGTAYTKNFPSEALIRQLSTNHFEATTNFDRLRDMDVIIVCVPTPLTPQREPDMQFVERAAREIADRLRQGQLIVLEFTTYPGTTRGVVQPILEHKGLHNSEDFLVAYSPEREDPGNTQFEMRDIPKVIGAGDLRAREAVAALYGSAFSRVVPVSTLETAEAVKLTENIFRAVNIALVNELKLIFERMDIDIWEVIEAAKTKPFGFMPFYPGPGLGGHCIPIDPFYLSWKARELGLSARFIELAGEINTFMPNYVVERLTVGLSDHASKALKNARILLVGVAYKRNVDDCRESPALRLFDLLEQRGAIVDYYDPFVPALPATRRYPTLGSRRSLAWDCAAFSTYDAAIICTDHDGIDYGELASSTSLVIDTRNATRQIDDAVCRGKIIKA